MMTMTWTQIRKIRLVGRSICGVATVVMLLAGSNSANATKGQRWLRSQADVQFKLSGNGGSFTRILTNGKGERHPGVLKGTFKQGRLLYLSHTRGKKTQRLDLNGPAARVVAKALNLRPGARAERAEPTIGRLQLASDVSREDVRKALKAAWDSVSGSDRRQERKAAWDVQLRKDLPRGVLLGDWCFLRAGGRGGHGHRHGRGHGPRSRLTVHG